MSGYIVGADIGQASDYTAIAVCEEVAFLSPTGRGEKGLHVRHLDRFRHVPYPDVVDRIENLLNTPMLRGRSSFVMDSTGVGKPLADLFKKRGRQHKAVLITGGDAEHRGEDGAYRVPKRNLVSGVQILLQGGRLKIAGGMELTEVLKAELLNFRVKINLATSHDSYGAGGGGGLWREGDHDDLVLSVAMAAWALGTSPMIPGALSNETLLKPSYWTALRAHNDERE